MALRTGVINVVPEPRDVPPVDAANQSRVPALAVAPRVTLPESQRAAGVVEVTTGVIVTVATIGILPDAQVEELACA